MQQVSTARRVLIVLTFETRAQIVDANAGPWREPSVLVGKRVDLVEDMSRPFGFEIPMGGIQWITTVGLAAAV